MDKLPPLPRRRSVIHDWTTELSPEKARTYDRAVRDLEVAYTMFSVSLDEAMGMRRYGRLPRAYQALSVCPALGQRLAGPVQGLLRAMHRHVRHFGTAPSLAPLDPANFQGVASQRAARFNRLFSKVLLARRNQFLHKVSALADMVEDLQSSLNRSFEALADPADRHLDSHWETLDVCHYDLNTCLRESVVLLKSFLHAVPEGQAVAFHAALEEEAARPAVESSVPARNLAHRRMAFSKGQ